MFMKNKLKIILLVTIIFIGTAFSAVAQQSTFNNETLYNLEGKAKTVADNSVVRVTVLEEVFENSSKIATSSEKYINEVIPSNVSNSVYKSHFIVEKKSKNGTERTEYIDIGNQKFVKKNGDKWQIFKPEGSGSGSGNGTGSDENVKVESSSQNKLQLGVTINHQKTDYYETTITYKFLYPTGTITSYVKNGRWFDTKGRYVKTIEESFDGKTKKLSLNTTEYEYNPNITIEAPLKTEN